MAEDIIINEGPFKRMKFVDLLNESEEMKWKILEYHNQKHVMDHIVGPLFTKEGHIKFLEALPTMKRKHYIVYFDGRAIGKYSFLEEGDDIVDTGDYLFHEEDMNSGLGILMREFIVWHFIENLHAKNLCFSVRKDNRQQISLMKKSRINIVDEDDKKYYYRLELPHHYVKGKIYDMLDRVYNK